MATLLDKPLARELKLAYKSRKVVLTVSPATPMNAEKCIAAMPERIEIRFKGSQEKPLYITTEDFLRLLIRRAMVAGKL